MTLRILSLTLILALGANQAAAELIPVEESYELGAELVILPSTTTGSLLLRACAQCPVKAMQVDEQTQFILGKHSVTLQEFRRYGVMKGLIMVFFEHDSDRVTRVRLPKGAIRPIHGLDVERDVVRDLDVDSDSDD